MLKKGIERFKVNFYNDGDSTFMVGWMVTIAFWIFGTAFREEEEGKKMLK